MIRMMITPMINAHGILSGSDEGVPAGEGVGSVEVTVTGGDDAA